MEQDKDNLSEGTEVSETKKSSGFRVSLGVVRNLVLASALILLGWGVGYGMAGGSVENAVGLRSNPMPLQRDELDFRMFWEVWDTLEASYLEPEDIDYQKMINGAIKGMTSALGDPYTTFLPPADNKRAKEDLNGSFEGVGIQLGYRRDTIAVMAPLDEMPAIKQGVRAGDLILNIKDEAREIDTDTIGMTLPEAVLLIRGPKGTPVTLTLYREDRGTFEVEIVRDTILVPSVELSVGDWDEEASEWVESSDGKVAWIKLRRFGDRTRAEWDEAIRDIIRLEPQLDGVVLDVRNNPGGYLMGAIDLASEFILDGVIVQQQGRTGTETFEVSRIGRLPRVNMVVLMNGGSASASEILAGALRDRIGAVLVGERSFGKGTVQEAVDLRDGAGIHVTTSRWLLPSGDWIHEDGLEPDVIVELDDVDMATDSAELVDRQLERAAELVGEGTR
jgi:carboxyl-terminal processing protease